MKNLHFRVPVTLDVSVSLGTTEATDTTAKKWRPWPKSRGSRSSNCWKT